MLRVDHVVSFL
jgi:hypothetical protein